MADGNLHHQCWHLHQILWPHAGPKFEEMHFDAAFLYIERSLRHIDLFGASGGEERVLGMAQQQAEQHELISEPEAMLQGHMFIFMVAIRF